MLLTRLDSSEPWHSARARMRPFSLSFIVWRSNKRRQPRLSSRESVSLPLSTSETRQSTFSSWSKSWRKSSKLLFLDIVHCMLYYSYAFMYMINCSIYKRMCVCSKFGRIYVYDPLSFSHLSTPVNTCTLNFSHNQTYICTLTCKCKN